MYEDYSRGCVDKFPGIMAEMDFKICQSSEGYNKCVIYNFITKSDACCKYIGKCISPDNIKADELIRVDLEFAEKLVKMLFKIAEEYCTSDNKVNCARYKIFKEGKEAATDLLPNGTRREELPPPCETEIKKKGFNSKFGLM